VFPACGRAILDTPATTVNFATLFWLDSALVRSTPLGVVDCVTAAEPMPWRARCRLAPDAPRRCVMGPAQGHRSGVGFPL